MFIVSEIVEKTSTHRQSRMLDLVLYAAVEFFCRRRIGDDAVVEKLHTNSIYCYHSITAVTFSAAERNRSVYFSHRVIYRAYIQV